MKASMDDLRDLVDRLRGQTQQAESTRVERDTAMAALHESGQATHRELAKVTGMAVSGVRAAINRASK